MPGGNGIGPLGQGPMTGRGAGFCAGYSQPGYATTMGGRGYGRFAMGARGGGRGWRNRFYATGQPFWARGYQAYPGQYGNPSPYQEMTPDSELSMLRNQAEFLEKEVSEIHERIKELEEISKESRESG